MKVNRDLLPILESDLYSLILDRVGEDLKLDHAHGVYLHFL